MTSFADRVCETTQTIGTGPVTLLGALSEGYQPFSAAFVNGDTPYYAIVAVDAIGNPTGQWEIGRGTFAYPNLYRSTVYSVSPGDASPVDFSAGTKRVWCDIPAFFATTLLNWLVPNVKDFGAIGDESHNDTNAVLAMASAMGYVRFGPGSYFLSTATVDAPLIFDYGASLYAGAGQTITITNRIEAPRYWIFQGTGAYGLQNDGNSGEDARQVHASWFGAVPTGIDNSVDMIPRFAALFAAVGNTRESVVDVDIGRYTVKSGCAVPRACMIRGMHTRRTVFAVEGSGYDVFTTSGVGVRFEGIQFETWPTNYMRTSGSFITIDHGECEAEDIQLQNAVDGIVINALNANIKTVRATYAAYPGAGSSVVRASGSQSDVSGISVDTSSAYGPEALVSVGGASTVSATSVRNLKYLCPSIAVLLNASAANVVRTSVDDVTCNTYSGTKKPVVKTVTGGASIVQILNMSNMKASSYASALLRVEQGSSGYTEEILLNQCSTASENGIELVRTSGAIRDVIVSDTCNLKNCTTSVLETGTSISSIRVSPFALADANVPVCYGRTIADDGVVVIDLMRPVYTGKLTMTQGVNFGEAAFRAATTPTLTSMGLSANVNLAAAGTVLTGTTGTDGKITISVSPETIYVENRGGSQQFFSIEVSTGVI
jgi:hypothetical protein